MIGTCVNNCKMSEYITDGRPHEGGICPGVYSKAYKQTEKIEEEQDRQKNGKKEIVNSVEVLVELYRQSI